MSLSPAQLHACSRCVALRRLLAPASGACVTFPHCGAKPASVLSVPAGFAGQQHARCRGILFLAAHAAGEARACGAERRGSGAGGAALGVRAAVGHVERGVRAGAGRHPGRALPLLGPARLRLVHYPPRQGAAAHARARHAGGPRCPARVCGSGALLLPVCVPLWGPPHQWNFLFLEQGFMHRCEFLQESASAVLLTAPSTVLLCWCSIGRELCTLHPGNAWERSERLRWLAAYRRT